jgi:hypothetical protein
MKPIAVGCITLTSCHRQPLEDEDDGSFPFFLVKGYVRLDGVEHGFERKVGLSLGDRDSEETHVGGLDLDEVSGPQPARITEDLYNCVYQSPAYQEAWTKFEGKGIGGRPG